jgi:hypothetical protein
MFRVFTGGKYPEVFNAQGIENSMLGYATLVEDPAKAQLFVFPVFYEVLVDYSADEYIKYKVTKEDVQFAKDKLTQMSAFAKQFNKPLILIFYRDPSYKIDIPNVVVFRTSLYKKERGSNEFGMPAIVTDLLLQHPFQPILKSANPSVGFRGQSAPLKLPFTAQLRLTTNELLQQLHIPASVEMFYNRGYIARRSAIQSCLKNTQITAEITITTPFDIENKNSNLLFEENILNNQYSLAVSGHGNYSFRLYQILSAGRVPLFIDTDCVLPYEEFIDWKKHLVWVDEHDAKNADKILLDFHHTIHPDDFVTMQESNRKLWEQYLNYTGFFSNLKLYFERLVE